jgi:hypothetical protein
VEPKTIYNGLSITGLALSNQSPLPAFFSPGQVNSKINHLILPNQPLRKMTCQDWPNPRRRLIQYGQIPEDELLTLATSRLGHAKISKEDLMKPAA